MITLAKVFRNRNYGYYGNKYGIVETMDGTRKFVVHGSTLLAELIDTPGCPGEGLRWRIVPIRWTRAARGQAMLAGHTSASMAIAVIDTQYRSGNVNGLPMMTKAGIWIVDGVTA